MNIAASVLLLVDIQNDFCPGGALAVRDGDRILRPVTRLMPQFEFVVATQDWHPRGHCSFQAQGGPWPEHCVQGTWGAELHHAIDPAAVNCIVQKGDQPVTDAYSGFDGHDVAGRALHDLFQERKVTTLYVAGLATDYCVRVTVLDGLTNGYEVYVVTDAIRAVNVKRGDGGRALAEMVRHGAHLVTSRTILNS